MKRQGQAAPSARPATEPDPGSAHEHGLAGAHASEDTTTTTTTTIERQVTAAAHHFDVVIATDCLWLEAQHERLLWSMRHFLSFPHEPSTASLSSSSSLSSSKQAQNPSSPAAPSSGREEPSSEQHGPDARAFRSTNPSTTGKSGRNPLVWITAGFHTGRDVIGKFLELVDALERGHDPKAGHDPDRVDALERGHAVNDHHGRNEEEHRHGKGGDGKEGGGGKGLKVESIHEQDMQGRTRPWLQHRPGETLEERKKWVVVIVLGWRT